MKKQLHKIYSRLRGKTAGFFVLCMVMGITVGLAPNVSFAQTGDTPPANTTIGNQASATYTDSGGNQRTVTSNTVETVVQQVAAVDISPGVTKQVSVNGQVEFAHTLTNNGNGTDSFALTTAEGANDFNFDNIAIYADENADGVPDDLNNAITVTPSLAAGESFSFVIVADVPGNVANGDFETIDITGTSNFDGGESDTEQNTATVSENAVIGVTKSQSQTSGNEGDTITITLTYTNSGNTDAQNLVLEDVLQQPGFSYVAGSGRWSGSGNTALGDNAGNGDDPSGITYEENNGTISATIASVSAGQQGTLTFQVSVDAGTAGQTITNTASYNYENEGDPNQVFANDQNTNTTQYRVNENFDVQIVGDREVTVAQAGQGATIDFVNEFQNTGSSADRYNITLDNSNYPAGTTFTLFRSDGSGNATNPLTDSNNDGIPDVGPVSAGSNFQVILRVSLPSNANGGPFSVDKIATSVGDPNESDFHTDTITEVTATTVDITNGGEIGSGDETGVGSSSTGEATPVETNSADPGTTTSFDLYINNTSGRADNYNLAAGIVSGGTFSPGLPNGFSVQFRDPANGNTVITNTGQVAAGGFKQVTAVVTVPADAAPGVQDVYFRARSASTGALDVKHDAVDVNTLRDLSLVANQNGQVAPGGSIVYAHTLSNEGNVVENDGTNSSIELLLANSQANGFTTVLYVDNNGDGEIDSGDTQIQPGGSLPGGALNAGDQVQLLVRVNAGTGVSDGTTNTTTLTAQDDGTGQDVNGVPAGNLTVNVQDITTVVVGNLVVEKFQSLTEGSGYVKTDLDADPGDIVYYRIVATNQGSATIENITITDTTPAFTTLEGQATVAGNDSGTVDSQPADGEAGTITVTSSTLDAGNSIIIDFAVQIDGSN